MTNIQARPASESLFNKNFALGAVAGLVVGAFVLPMLLNMIGGDAPAKTQALASGPAPVVNVLPEIADDPTFIDNAISVDAP